MNFLAKISCMDPAILIQMYKYCWNKNGLGHDLSLKILNFILPNLMTTE